ncbi:MAG TPA: hypothetical protein VMU75_16175 [Acidimicrobiales bacterium]|nr:hypothetical protein [Acidimicrobiales bacterium]
MAEWFSIEVLNGASSAMAWADAFADVLTQAGISEGAVDWQWRHHPWGSLLEIEFADELDFERFRSLPVVEAALDAVPDRVNGLLIHRGRGGSSGTRRPRRPVPMVGSGSAALPLPEEDLGWWVAGAESVEPRAEPVRVGRVSA